MSVPYGTISGMCQGYLSGATEESASPYHPQCFNLLGVCVDSVDRWLLVFEGSGWYSIWIYKMPNFRWPGIVLKCVRCNEQMVKISCLYHQVKYFLSIPLHY